MADQVYFDVYGNMFNIVTCEECKKPRLKWINQSLIPYNAVGRENKIQKFLGRGYLKLEDNQHLLTCECFEDE